MHKPSEKEPVIDVESHIENLKAINRATSRELWQMGDFQTQPEALGGRLIFPAYSERDDGKSGKEKNNTEKKRRISEQEARFVYCRVLERCNGYFYSVETPTEESYRFSSGGERSAMSDLSLYDVSDLKKVVNVEFKAHNPSKSAIHKDVVKLVKEAFPRKNGKKSPQVVIGNWYHLLDSVNSGTIPSILSKFHSVFDSNDNGDETVMEKNVEKQNGAFERPEELYILFTICILDLKIAVERLFVYPEEESCLEKEWMTFFSHDKRETGFILPPSLCKSWTYYGEDGKCDSEKANKRTLLKD